MCNLSFKIIVHNQGFDWDIERLSDIIISKISHLYEDKKQPENYLLLILKSIPNHRFSTTPWKISKVNDVFARNEKSHKLW